MGCVCRVALAVACFLNLNRWYGNEGVRTTKIISAMPEISNVIPIFLCNIVIEKLVENCRGSREEICEHEMCA